MKMLSRLQSAASKCDFKSTLNERLRDQLIIGLRNPEIQSQIICKFTASTSDLHEVAEYAKTLEDSKKSVEEINKKRTEESSKDLTITVDPGTTCLRCGNRKHREIKSCPAINESCNLCKGRGHFARVCIKSGKVVIKKDNKTINIVELDNALSSDYSHLYTLNKESQKDPEGFKIDVEIEGIPTTMIVDSGASVSCLSKQLWKKIGRPKLTYANHLRGYANSIIRTMGRTIVNVKAGSKDFKLPVTITDKNNLPILGIDGMKTMGIDIMYGNIFQVETDSGGQQELNRLLQRFKK
ncbi:LOW QUALITY PROTEIN: hypothetical protein HZS_6097, partial [Henneguya salminicola]